MNTELGHAVIQHIIDHPEQHEQTIWDCGTTACIAGHVVRLSGVRCRGFSGYSSASALHALGVDPRSALGDQIYASVFLELNKDAALAKFKDILSEHEGDEL